MYHRLTSPFFGIYTLFQKKLQAIKWSFQKPYLQPQITNLSRVHMPNLFLTPKPIHLSLTRFKNERNASDSKKGLFLGLKLTPKNRCQPQKYNLKKIFFVKFR